MSVDYVRTRTSWYGRRPETEAEQDVLMELYRFLKPQDEYFLVMVQFHAGASGDCDVRTRTYATSGNLRYPIIKTSSSSSLPISIRAAKHPVLVEGRHQRPNHRRPEQVLADVDDAAVQYNRQTPRCFQSRRDSGCCSNHRFPLLLQLKKWEIITPGPPTGSCNQRRVDQKDRTRLITLRSLSPA